MISLMLLLWFALTTVAWAQPAQILTAETPTPTPSNAPAELETPTPSPTPGLAGGCNCTVHIVIETPTPAPPGAVKELPSHRHPRAPACPPDTGSGFLQFH
jgi:hypothetical protein